MWKYVSRRVRDTFEKSANYFDKRSTAGVANSSNGNFSDDKKSSAPPSCNWFCSRKCWNSFTNDSNTKSKRWNFEDLNRSWIGAITWSSALVAGWYTSQIIHLKVKYRYNEQSKRCIFNKSLKSLYPFATYVNKNALYLDSSSKIEKIIGTFIPTVHLVSNEQNGVKKEAINSGASGSSSSSSENYDLGSVLNTLENRLALAAIRKGQHREGLNLLRSAANRNHAPATYNLGLCYEMGIGVKVNEKMAVLLYRSAAASEHSGALYNLGIYYGQGRGGLAKDTETATRLLRLAAVQGHKEAIDALKVLGEDDTPHEKERNTWTQSFTSCAPNDNIVPAPTTLFVENLNFSHIQDIETTVY